MILENIELWDVFILVIMFSNRMKIYSVIISVCNFICYESKVRAGNSLFSGETVKLECFMIFSYVILFV